MILRGLLLAMIAALLASPVCAHQQKETITRVLFNPRTGNIEVMHRFLLHDAEHASQEVLGQSADLLGSAADRERFEQYVHRRFSIEDQDGNAIDLVPVGNEIETRFLWIYAEAPIPDGLVSLTLSHDALRDLWPDQINLVNVERDKTVRSATFVGGKREITVEL